MTNLYWPIAVQVITAAVMFAYVAYMRASGDTTYSWRFFLPGNPQASARGPVPMHQLALFSLFDQLNAAMQAPPAPFISLPLQSIMSNLVIVWTAALAFICLRSRFRQVHVVGCVLIVLSVIVGVSDKLEDDDCSPYGVAHNKCLSAYKTAQGTYKVLSGSSMALWYGLFLLGTVPSGISNVYKQHVLQGADVDVMYAT